MANYMKKIAADDQLFASFFWWRKFYEIHNGLYTVIKKVGFYSF